MQWLFFIFSALDLRPVQGVDAGTDQLRILINIVLSIMGAVAALIIVIAGFRFITSQGNPSETATARNAILYASVGLVVIITAFAIVNLVVLGVG